MPSVLGAFFKSDEHGHIKVHPLNVASAKALEALKEKIAEKIKRKIGNYLYSNWSMFISCKDFNSISIYKIWYWLFLFILKGEPNENNDDGVAKISVAENSDDVNPLPELRTYSIWKR